MCWSKRRSLPVLAGAVVCAALLQPRVGLAATDSAEADQAAFFSSPVWNGPNFVNGERWAELEALVAKTYAAGERDRDGKLVFFAMTTEIERAPFLSSSRSSGRFVEAIADYRRQFPQSAFAPILQAMHLRGAAWRVRGTGPARSLPADAVDLFATRMMDAWNVLQAAKAQSSKLPTWYELGVEYGIDAGVPPAELEALLAEGMRRHPTYYPLQFPLLRAYSPRWGGNYALADAYILRTVASPQNKEGEVMYTRLYRLLDDNAGRPPGFFQLSKINWPRMRAGFIELMRRYPESTNLPAYLMSYACRAADWDTYRRYRPVVDEGQFDGAAPDGMSVDICDERAARARRDAAPRLPAT